MATVLQLGIDVDGVSESRVFAFDFKNFPEIVGGDTLSGMPIIEFEPADPALTMSAIGVLGTQAQVTISVTGGVPNAIYQGSCRMTTAAGNILIAYGNLLLIGPV